MDVHGQRHEVSYWPGDSLSGMFGGNSNWRGPICKQFLILLVPMPNIIFYRACNKFYPHWKPPTVLPILWQRSPSETFYWHSTSLKPSLLSCFKINRLNVPLVVAITWIFRQSPEKSNIVSFTSLGVTWRAVEQQMEETRSWTTTPIFVTTSGFTRCFLFHIHSPHSSTYKLPFSQFFHADSGKGLGASHQTGWWVAFYVYRKQEWQCVYL